MKLTKILALSSLVLLGSCSVVQNPRQINTIYLTPEEIITESSIGQNHYKVLGMEVGTDENGNVTAYKLNVEWVKK